MASPRARASLRWDEIPTTRWTLVDRAGAAPCPTGPTERGGSGAEPSAMGELLALYLPVLRGHLVGTLRIGADRVDDLLQGFLADQVVERNLIAQADPARGRFRRFLLTSLNRYITDVARHDAAAKRCPASGPPLPIADVAEPHAPGPDAAERFDRLWANEVLGAVMRRTRATCQAAGRLDCWAVLEARILQPITTGTSPVPHVELAARLGLPSPAHAAHLLAAGKRLFTETFRRVVAEYVQGPDAAGQIASKAVDEEIRELWAVFSSGR